MILLIIAKLKNEKNHTNKIQVLLSLILILNKYISRGNVKKKVPQNHSAKNILRNGSLRKVKLLRLPAPGTPYIDK